MQRGGAGAAVEKSKLTFLSAPLFSGTARGVAQQLQVLLPRRSGLRIVRDDAFYASSLIRSVAPPFKTGPAASGSGFVLLSTGAGVLPNPAKAKSRPIGRFFVLGRLGPEALGECRAASPSAAGGGYSEAGPAQRFFIMDTEVLRWKNE
jgi:hypothetical protein